MTFPASWADLTAESESRARTLALADRSGDVYFIIHHAVNRRVQDTIALSKPGGRTVSMSFAVGPTVAGNSAPVYCVAVVPEWRRPFTTGSPLDDRAVTVEVSNVDLAAPWPVADAAKEWLAQIAAYMHRVYAMPLNRTHVLSHQEVYARGFGSYPTACPGNDLQSALDQIIARASVLVTPKPKSRRKGMTTRFVQIGTGGSGFGVGAVCALAGDAGFAGPGNFQEYTRTVADGSVNDRAAQEFAVHGPSIPIPAAQWAALKASYTQGGVVSGGVDLQPVLDALGAVPTAAQNGAAARAAIVK